MRRLLTLVAALVTGCASTPRSAEDGPSQSSQSIPPLPTTPAPELPVASESLRAAYARQVVITPIQSKAPLDERMKALALGQLLAHAIENDRDTSSVGLAHHGGLYPNPELARLALVNSPGRRSRPSEGKNTDTLPPGLAASHIRYVVGGTLYDDRIELWLMDRLERRIHRKTAILDFPYLVAPRLALASLLADGGAPPNELTRADMTWYEDLTPEGLAWVGRALFAIDFERDPGPIIEQALARAPMSYTASVVSARHHFLRDSDCGERMIARYTHMTSLHRNTPLILSTQILACELARELDPTLPSLPTWSKRGDATCRIGAKALTSIGAARGSLSGDVSIGPAGGFVTGLGGIYRGDTCDAGLAVGGLEEESTLPAWTRAALELEAAFYEFAEGQLRRAERWFESAKKSAATGDKPSCIQELFGAEATLGLADLSLELGQYEDATTSLASAEEVATRCADTRMLGRIANSRGILAQSRSAMDEALAQFTKGHDVFRRLGDEMNVAVALTNLGVTWLHLGRHDKAVPLLEEALKGKLRVRSKGGVAALYENLGVAELARGNAEKAEQHFQASLALVTDSQTKATLLVQMARLALARGDQALAQRHMDEAQEASKRVHARVLTAVIEQVKASMANEAGRFQDALNDFHSALAIRRSLGDRLGEGITLTLLMQVANRMKRPELGILYGKLAVQAHEDVRASAKAIDKETARQFLATRAETYRVLAGLMVNSGRLVEAERVLGLLKEDEANTWTRSAHDRSALPLTTAEKALDSRYREVADHVMALGREHSELAQKSSHTPAEKARLDELRKRLEAANEAFLGFLSSLGKDDALVKNKTLESLREDVGIGPDLADLGPGHVAVYTLVAGDTLHLIAVTPDAQTGHSIKLQPGMLDGLIAALREALMDPESDPKPIAGELYELLIKPIEKDLLAAKATTILWSLDRTLRYLPVAALWDGKRWAVERWAHSVFTPASHARLKDEPGPWKVLGLGVTRAHPPFSPLPAVSAELASIIGPGKGRLPGVMALDAEFTRDRFVTELGRRYPVVHLASHFAFAPGDKDNSFLLLGDGSKLTVSDLEKLPNLFAGVDLLTLSACNTATGDLPGDGQEVESFAVLAQRKGARAVFATLWPVADQSTGWLMSRFYQQKKTPKVMALRRAQLDLIAGKGEPAWRHPYHWAPFIVIGNTR
jgi:CHAT domain-containing protein/tetratricopeptide (TPR) repeat protein